MRSLAERAGIAMPEVAVYEGEPNAFATGAFKNSALVAVSTGLLQSMNREEVEAVLGHEIAHVANGDMVTLTLIQGVVNTFVVFLARVVGFFVDKVLLRDERQRRPGIGYMVTVFVCELVFGLLASHHRGLVLAPARIPRRRRLGQLAGQPAADAARADAPGRHAARRAAGRDECAGHRGQRIRLGRPVCHPPADGTAHRGPARRGLSERRASAR